MALKQPMKQRPDTAAVSAGNQEAGGPICCQPVADAKAFKAFKGRGAMGAKLAHLRAELDRIHAEQHNLSVVTRQVAGRQFYLAVHRRTATGQHSLRWRLANMRRGGHLAWGEMPQQFASLPDQLRDWYGRINDSAHELNEAELRARQSLRWMEQRGGTSPAPSNADVLDA